jgi:TATA-box binding protein (TBP) (component of TFIID and TFIIIB)
MESINDMKTSETIEYKDFDSINISTTTVIVSTNLEINLEWLFDNFKVLDVNTSGVSIKSNKDFQKHISGTVKPKYGSITMIEFKDKLKGFKLRKKKKNTKFFRNTLSIALYVGKLINMKIPTKGKLQMTGCISPEQAELCVKYLWDILSQYEQSDNSYRLYGDEQNLITIHRTKMTNKIFNTGFNVNRQNLDIYMNQNTRFTSLLETSFGYTGVNIKTSFDIDPENTKLTRLKCDKYNNWEKTYITLSKYLDSLSVNERTKENNKRPRITFLVFHSGTVIMSGMTVQYMKSVYNDFIEVLKNNRELLEEKITDN